MLAELRGDILLVDDERSSTLGIAGADDPDARPAPPSGSARPSGEGGGAT